MSEWLKNLAPEFYIIFLGGLVLIILIIVILFYVMHIVREIAGKALKLNEEIVSEDKVVYTLLKIINKSYIDNQIRGIGIIYNKKKHVINDHMVTIEARNKHEILVSHAEIRKLLSIEDFKINRLKFYYENSIGDTRITRGKLTRRKIKATLKEEKKDFIKAEKQRRYETGQFIGRDRFVLFFQKIFRPFKRMSNNYRVKRNKKIADQRIKREIEIEREALIHEQKLIYDQQVREKTKKELSEKYKIEELKDNLEKMKNEEIEESTFVPVEKIIGFDEEEKPKKKSKKKNPQTELELGDIEESKTVEEIEPSGVLDSEEK